MALSRVYLNFLLLLLLLCPLLFCPSAASSGPEDDRAALLPFKVAITSDPGSFMAAWNGFLDVCLWPGIACNDSDHPGRVSSLSLDSLGLEGVISPSIANLSYLNTLLLGNNSFHGGVPTEMSSSLEKLDISSNKLTGEIPSSIGDLFNLSYLDLSGNQLTGAIPQDMAKLSALQHLELSNNTLTGELPSWMGRNLPLDFLALSGNNLTGSLPDSLGNLVNLTHLDLSKNGLTGSIPASFTGLSLLQDMDLSYNNLEGSLPEEIGRLKSLQNLQLNENELSGNIPPSLFNITSLGTLSMAFNHLSGTLPPDMGITLPNLRILRLANNKLEGSIPRSLGNATLLKILNLSVNNFSGRIPAIFGRLTNLQQFSLISNSLVAANADDWEFLSSLANSPRLKFLNLDENYLAGELPSSLGNLTTQLEGLTLGWNSIHGSFPLGIRRYVNLKALSLNDNLLTGEIPDFLGELVSLESLVLYNNQFSGEIPAGLSNLTRLNQLLLNGNFFHGRIPAALGNLQNLIFLSISDNQLSGVVPKEILSIRSLANFLDLSNNYLTGELPPEVGQLSNLQFLSFHNNSLSGRIPSSIGDCQVLQFLNLSRNSFEGEIPASLGKLKGLTRLDLSFNNLSGPIPDFLADFPVMKRLDLSFNDFNGEVPADGTFANSSEVSVAGNSKLCGGVSSFNLPSCPSHEPKKRFPLALKISLPILALIFLLSLFTTCYFVKKPKRVSLRRIEEAASTPYKVSYFDLKKATDDFSPENFIGSGSYGSVYRGQMADGEALVAIKVLDMQQPGASKSFIAECEALRNIRHRNLVKIVTTCVSVDFRGDEFRAILFEFMPNGSLENWLHPEPNGELYAQKLGLLQRLDIAIDVAAALNYLHDHCETPIVHCDLKPSNVLLDEDMTACVGDFGIARFLPRSAKTYQSSSLAIKGSIGYMAPEYGMGGQVSTQGDVYSYGVLLLELFTGKRPTDDMFSDGLTLQKYVAEKLSQGVGVAGIAEEQLASEGMKQCLESVLVVGLCCAKESPRERISIADALTRLESIKNLLLI